MPSHLPLVSINPSLTGDQSVDLFAEAIYGHLPTVSCELTWTLLRSHYPSPSLNRQQWALDLRTERGDQRIVVLVNRPAGDDVVPAFLGLNFYGNHSCTVDPQIFNVEDGPGSLVGSIYYDNLRERPALPIPRGMHSGRWPSELVTERGYAIVTACYLQAGPDHAGIFDRGLHKLLDSTTLDTRAPDDWGSISIWAWLLSRILDALEGGMVPGIDSGRVAVVGHSRLGKAALWAAANDHRFAAVFSNNSGCMGAALSREVGETPQLLAEVRPFWFSRTFSEITGSGHPLPVDQHQLLSALAPRPLYVASASLDPEADPEGEYRSIVTAANTWGSASPLGVEFPGENEVRHAGTVPLGFHLRQGVHDVTPWDWEQWLDFADRWL